MAGYRIFDEVLGRSAYPDVFSREVDVGMLLGVVACCCKTKWRSQCVEGGKCGARKGRVGCLTSK